MIPLVAVEAETGAQLLPRPTEPHPRQKMTTWAAIQCLGADHRAKYPVYADLAARIIIVPAPSPGQEGGNDVEA